MKTMKPILSAVALATAIAGTALAGPSNPASSFTGIIPVRQAQGCPMMKSERKLVSSQNVKANGPVQKTIGYRHEGCTGGSVTKMTCGPSGAACASMRRG